MAIIVVVYYVLQNLHILECTAEPTHSRIKTPVWTTQTAFLRFLIGIFAVCLVQYIGLPTNNMVGSTIRYVMILSVSQWYLIANGIDMQNNGKRSNNNRYAEHIIIAW